MRFEELARPARSSSRPTPSSGSRPPASAAPTSGRIAASSRRSPDADGPRVLRHRRGGRQRGHDDQAGPVRRRFVLRRPTTPARICRDGYQSSCVHREFLSGAQAPHVPRAARRRHAGRHRRRPARRPDPEPAGHLRRAGHRLVRRRRGRTSKPGATVAVVGDGAVGLLGVLSAKQMGAERIIAMSRHESRQKLAREFGATDIVTERGDEGVARIKELTEGRRRRLRPRVRGHAGVDDAGDPRHPPGRRGRLRRRPARRRARRRAAVLLPRAPARRPGAGAPLPAAPDRSRPERAPSTPARSSTSRCPSTRWRRAIARWTSGARSRRCCARSEQ